jgi:environmental stress-induced protein Ves
MPMKILPPERFLTTPWKNGGGITHEIARLEAGGRMVWRLSVAEVGADGPFSRFDGLMRILTVIEGAGLSLVTPAGNLAALPCRPVRFPGDLPVDGRLIAGPVRDLNVIFDPGLVEARVDHLRAAEFHLPPASEGRSFALYCLAGEINAGQADRVAAGSAALFTDPSQLRPMPGTEALLVTFDRQVRD